MRWAGYIYLVRSWIVTESYVAVDSENDVLGRELGDGEVKVNDLEGGGLNKGLPVLQRPSILSIVGF
jgi:hypothetical protein